MHAFVLLLAMAFSASSGGLPREAAWLDSLPGDVAIVLRLGGIEASRGELDAMLGAMGPAVEGWARPVLEDAVGRFVERYGAAASESPLLVIFQLPPADAPPWPLPFAIVAGAEASEDIRRALAGGEGAAMEERPGGYEAVTSADGQTRFLVRSGDLVAFGPDEGLIASVASLDGSTLGEAISGDLRERLFSGEVGVSTDMVALRRRYAVQIFLLRRFSSGIFDRLAGMMGNPGVAESAAILYERVHLDLVDTTSFAFGIDVDAEGLELEGVARVRPGSALAGRLAEARPGSAEKLAALPADATQYLYQESGPEGVLWLERVLLAFLGRELTARSPDLQRLVGLYEKAGRVELVYASGGPRGYRLVYLPSPEDHEAMVRGMTTVLEVMDGPEEGFVSGVEFEPDAERFGEVSLTRATVRFDFEGLEARRPDLPFDPEAMRSFFGGETMTEWLGTDGRRVLSVIASDWKQASGLLERTLAGDQGLGTTAGFEAVRSRLPGRVINLALFRIGGHPASSEIGQESARADWPGADGPALVGTAVAPVPGGYLFELFVPSTAGRAIDQELIAKARSLFGGAEASGRTP